MAAGTCFERVVKTGSVKAGMELEHREKQCKRIKQEPWTSNNKGNLSPTRNDICSSRRNKRKMSEPKKRSDFSVKRLCSSAASGSDGDQCGSESDSPGNQREGVVEESTEVRSRTTDQERTDTESHQSGVIQTIQTGRELLIPNIYHRVPMLYDPAHRLALHSSIEQHPGDLHLGDPGGAQGQRRTRKNYKNMTRERRVEANARERTRVHTISAAFESLRRAVPSYSYNQKLSKLAILKIASSYILALSKLAEGDIAERPSRPTFAECVDMCTHTIQTEGRIRRRH